VIAILIDKKGFHKSMNITGLLPVIEIFEYDNSFGNYSPESPQFYVSKSMTTKKVLFYRGSEISNGVYEYRER
jgi:hypothetical protein